MTGANCVEAPPGRGPAVRRSSDVRTSRDDHLLIEQRHRCGQAHGFEHLTPEVAASGGASEFGYARPQVKLEGLAAIAKPVPPATDRAPIGDAAASAMAQRETVQQLFQNALLHRPVVPATRGDAQRQARTGTAACRAAEIARTH